MDHKKSTLPQLITGVILILTLCSLSFWGVISYQKNHTPKITAQAEQPTHLAQPVLGKVTAVSNTSVTIKPQNGVSKTYAIDKNTTINISGSSSTPSIQIGNTALVQTTAANTSLASRILLNPNI